MIQLPIYIIGEGIDDNLFWKLDKWFYKFPEQKSKFIDIVAQCRKSRPDKSTIDFMLRNIGFDVSSFVNFVLDNADGKSNIDDCTYIMSKVIDTIIANKQNEYNNEKN